MAKKQEEKPPKWFLVLLGLCFLLVIFRPEDKPLTAAEISPLTITAKHDIDLIKGARSEFSFRIAAKEHLALFVVNRAGENAAISRDSLKNIKQGDRLHLQIANSRLNDLTNRVANIPVYALSKNGLQYYDLEKYTALRAPKPAFCQDDR